MCDGSHDLLNGCVLTSHHLSGRRQPNGMTVASYCPFSDQLWLTSVEDFERLINGYRVFLLVYAQLTASSYRCQCESASKQYLTHHT